jgi:hypothetical protein
MFGPDPIDFFDPAPYGALAYYGHYLLGTIALVAAFTAFAVKKGKGKHRIAGLIYIAAIAVLSLTTISMLSERMIPPLMMAVVTSISAIGGAYLALQSGSARVKAGEYVLSLFQLTGLIVFLSIAVPEALSGRIPLAAPAIIAIIPVILLAGDLYWFLNPAKRRSRRVARHLSCMIWAFVVVLRAPLVEIAAAGVPIPAPAVVIGPIALAIAMHWYFQRIYGGKPFGKSA